ncbi:MAG: hypothetical protein M3Q97_01745 [Bacteroidota bacterium]|nr:hypothetical protein [Bacteroidota bacterium]
MKDLFLIEWIKNRYSRTFWIYSILYLAVVLLALSLILTTIGQLAQITTYPAIWLSFPYLASYLNIIVGLIIINSVSNEFLYRTFRQHVIDGMSRISLLNSKYLYAIVLSIVASVLILLLILVFGKSSPDVQRAFGDTGALANVDVGGPQNIAKLFLQLLGYSSMAILFGLLIKTPGLATGAYVVYILALEPLLRFIITYLSAGNIQDVMSSTERSLASYLPMKSFDRVLVSNWSTNFNEIITTDVTSIFVAIGYIVAIYFINYSLITKRDL